MIVYFSGTGKQCLCAKTFIEERRMKALICFLPYDRGRRDTLYAKQPWAIVVKPMHGGFRVVQEWLKAVELTGSRNCIL